MIDGYLQGISMRSNLMLSIWEVEDFVRRGSGTFLRIPTISSIVSASGQESSIKMFIDGVAYTKCGEIQLATTLTSDNYAFTGKIPKLHFFNSVYFDGRYYKYMEIVEKNCVSWLMLPISNDLLSEVEILQKQFQAHDFIIGNIDTLSKVFTIDSGRGFYGEMSGSDRKEGVAYTREPEMMKKSFGVKPWIALVMDFVRNNKLVGKSITNTYKVNAADSYIFNHNHENYIILIRTEIVDEYSMHYVVKYWFCCKAPKILNRLLEAIQL